MKPLFSSIILALFLALPLLAQDPASELARAEQNLRISQEALRSIESDIALMKQRGSSPSNLQALQGYAARQKRTVSLNQAKVDALRAQVPARPAPAPAAPEYQVARPAPTWKPNVDEDPLSALDRELRKSVSTFDSKLLRELDQIAQARESGIAGAGAVAAAGGAHSESGGGGGGQYGTEGGGAGQGGQAGQGQAGQAGGQQGQGGQDQGGQGQMAGGPQGTGSQTGQGGQAGQFPGQQGPGQPGQPGQGQVGQVGQGQGAGGQVAGGPGGMQGQGGQQNGAGEGGRFGTPGGGAGGGGDAAGTGSSTTQTRTTRPGASTDDIVARQLREAAEAEKDPALREKLWEEYDKYKGR